MYHILFVFLDGVGLGAHDPERNPLAALSLPSLERLTGGQRWTARAQPIRESRHVFHEVDPNLGVAGLPQSGTGQATLFTGINGAALAGRHFGPYPHSQTRAALAEHNLFLQVRRLGLNHSEPAAFANAYPPRFFTYARERDRWTVTTRCCLDADLPIRGLDDLRRGDALTADLTGAAWRERLGLDVPLLTEPEAGERLVRIGQRHRLTLFEYYLTDKAGHSRSPERAAEVLHALDGFFSGILRRHDPEEALLLVTSDHGNLEDLSTKSHTRNPVPLIAYGRGAPCFADVRDLTEVTPAVVTALRQHALDGGLRIVDGG